MSFIRRQVGLRTDEANSGGSLHAKVAFGLLNPFTPYSFGGNGVDGDVVVSANTTIGGIKQYNNLTVNAGATLACETGTIILVKNTLTVNGLITSSGKGGAGGAAAGYTGNNGFDGAGFCGSGGGGGQRTTGAPQNTALGGNGGSTNFPGGLSDTPYPYNPGSGQGTTYKGWSLDILAEGMGAGGGSGAGNNDGGYGGAGGAGGGSLIVEAKNLLVNSNGAIRADGINGGNATTVACGGGGGGGGGLLIVNCDLLTNMGVISAFGGTGGTGGGSDGNYMGPDGGNGGPGLLSVMCRRTK